MGDHRTREQQQGRGKSIAEQEALRSEGTPHQATIVFPASHSATTTTASAAAAAEAAPFAEAGLDRALLPAEPSVEPSMGPSVELPAEPFVEPLVVLPPPGAAEDPVLGQLLADLGNKRVYLTDVPKLMRLPVWERQRVYRPERAKAMAAECLKRAVAAEEEASGELESSSTSTSTSTCTSSSASSRTGGMAFPGVITLYEKAWEPAVSFKAAAASDASDEAWLSSSRARFGVVDGQHRVGALRELFGRGAWEGRVLVEVLPLPGPGAVAELFTDINKAEPVKDVDLPGAASEAERGALSAACGALAEAFPDLFKESARCRLPHVQVDNLREAIFEARVMDRHGLATETDLLAWLLKENDKLAAKSDRWWLQQGTKGRPGNRADPAYEKGLAKARAFGFFLGLSNHWLNH